MQRVALRDVDLASFRAAIGPEGCADGALAVQRGAVVQMAWEASQQLLTGTVRESAAGMRAGEIRTAPLRPMPTVSWPCARAGRPGIRRSSLPRSARVSPTVRGPTASGR